MADWAREKAKTMIAFFTNHEDGITAALRQARLDALEEAAKMAEDFTGAMHTAHDMRIGIFPKQSYMGEAISEAIRSLKEKQP